MYPPYTELEIVKGAGLDRGKVQTSQTGKTLVPWFSQCIQSNSSAEVVIMINLRASCPT